MVLCLVANWNIKHGPTTRVADALNTAGFSKAGTLFNGSRVVICILRIERVSTIVETGIFPGNIEGANPRRNSQVVRLTDILRKHWYNN